MCPLRYYTMLRQSKDRTYLRFEMVRYAREFGIKPCARRNVGESLEALKSTAKYYWLMRIM